ncbi:hypothetical protein JCM11251_006052 [Rhodosporidiobolus azoricus]
MPRIRCPLRPWPVRAYSTRPELPSPLQRELFRRVAQPVACITAHIPSGPSSTSSGSTHVANETAASGPPSAHNHGATLSSLASISLSPPLVSFSLRLPSRLASFLSPTTDSPSPPPTFRVHLLSTAQEPIARAFARQAPLPAPAAPSPPPSPPRPGENPWDQPFPPELFEQLEKEGLGWMDCRVVKRIPLTELGSGEGKVMEKGGWQPRSELFIAEVEKIQLGEEGRGSLVYWEQRYAGVPELERDGEV